MIGDEEFLRRLIQVIDEGRHLNLESYEIAEQVLQLEQEVRSEEISDKKNPPSEGFHSIL